MSRYNIFNWNIPNNQTNANAQRPNGQNNANAQRPNSQSINNPQPPVIDPNGQRAPNTQSEIDRAMIPILAQRQSCFDYLYNYMMVPMFLYNAYYLWPSVDKKNDSLYQWMIVTCWITLIDKLFFSLIILMVLYMCCFNLAGTNSQLR